MPKKTIEDYPLLHSWIKEQTINGDFITHPDFVEDTFMELLAETEMLKACIDEISEADSMGEISKTLRQYGIDT